VIHPKNGTGIGTEMRTAIIHAVGVVFLEKRETSNIIHAAGVRGAFPSGAPKARRVPG